MRGTEEVNPVGDAKSQVDQITGLIPQVFYDIIGRIIPGGTLLILAFLLCRPESWRLWSGGVEFDGIEIAYSWLFWIGLLFSYLIGIILGGPAYRLSEIKWNRWLSKDGWKKWLSKDKQKEHPEVVAQVPDSKLPRAGDYDSYIYDMIQLSEPSAGARLAKLSAERNMCRVLIAGFMLLAVVHLCRGPAGFRWLWASLLVAGAGCAWSFHRHLTKRSQRLMLNLWYRLVEQDRVKIRSAEGVSKSAKSKPSTPPAQS